MEAYRTGQAKKPPPAPHQTTKTSEAERAAIKARARDYYLNM